MNRWSPFELLFGDFGFLSVTVRDATRISSVEDQAFCFSYVLFRSDSSLKVAFISVLTFRGRCDVSLLFRMRLPAPQADSCEQSPHCRIN